VIGRALRALGRAARAAARRVRAALGPPSYDDELPIPLTWRDGESTPPSTPTLPAVPARMPGHRDPKPPN
jgi:hypothetical protein